MKLDRRLKADKWQNDRNLLMISLAMLLDSNFNAIKTPSPLCVSLKNSTEFRPPSCVKKSLQTSTIIRDSRKSRNHGNRDFRQMPWIPWFYQNAMFFCQTAAVLRFYKNILFLDSISWSLLCKFNTKIFTFPLPLLVRVLCYLLAQYVTVASLALHVMMVVNARCWVS